jgi:hypothetical protein
MGCALWVESCELRLFSERTTRNSQLFQLACLSRLHADADLKRGVGLGTRDGMNWEGEAPAEPNLSANREIGKSASRETAATGEAISEW